MKSATKTKRSKSGRSETGNSTGTKKPVPGPGTGARRLHAIHSAHSASQPCHRCGAPLWQHQTGIVSHPFEKRGIR